jgi:hypothetical protein
VKWNVLTQAQSDAEDDLYAQALAGYVAYLAPRYSAIRDGLRAETAHRWMSSALGKTSLYDQCADAFKNKAVLLHSFSTFTQLSSIDGSTLRAPDNLPNDRADSCALVVCGRAKALYLASTEVSQGPCLLVPGREPDPFDRFFGPDAGRFYPGW